MVRQLTTLPTMLVQGGVFGWAILSLTLTGCVPYQTYEAIKSDYARIKGAHDDLVVKYNHALRDILRLQKDGATGDINAEKVRNLEKLRDELQDKLRTMARGVPITPDKFKDVEGVAVTPEGELVILESVLFTPGEAMLKGASSTRVLDQIIDVLRKEYPNEVIHISGHTDNDPLEKTKKRWGYNVNLGYNRAYTVFQYFVDQRVPENRMVLHSFAWIDPADPGSSKEAKAKNRRVVIHLGGTKI